MFVVVPFVRLSFSCSLLYVVFVVVICDYNMCENKEREREREMARREREQEEKEDDSIHVVVVRLRVILFSCILFID